VAGKFSRSGLAIPSPVDRINAVRQEGPGNGRRDSIDNPISRRCCVRQVVPAMSILCAIAAAGPVGAAVFEVGPAAAYTMVQSAIDAAITAGGENEIRIQTGTYTENLVIDNSLLNGSLRLVGGWDSGFSTRSLDASLTVLDGNGAGRTLDIYNTGGTVALEGLTVTGGLADTQGAGVWSHPSASVAFEVINCRFVGNHLVNPSTYELGAGLYASAYHSVAVRITDTLFTENTISGDGGEGAGLVINAGLDSTTILRRVELFDNAISISDGNGSEGAGGSILLSGNATLLVDDLRVTDNAIDGTTIFANRGSGFLLGLLDSSQAELRRLYVAFNGDQTTGGAEQALIEAFSSSSVELSDSLVARGDGDCLTLFSYATATVHATNLTVADCPGRGLFLAAEVSGATSVTNTIAYGSSPDVFADAETALSSNLVGVDPLFVDALGGNYHLQGISDAVDTGTDSPVAGLGPKDFDGGPRMPSAPGRRGVGQSLRPPRIPARTRK